MFKNIKQYIFKNMNLRIQSDEIFDLKKRRKFLRPFSFTRIFTVLHFFWWHYLIKGGKKLFYKIISKSYVLWAW